MKALIVDDNAADRKILRANLEHHGYEVIEAGDGLEGLKMAVKHRPDIIISDALMPKMDGFQFLRAVKKDEALKPVPFVFHSAVYTGYREAELAVALGAEAFIVKPKDPEEFWTELSGILDDYRRQKEKPLAPELIEQEEEYLKKYSHIVATKLEEKVKELGDEIEERKKAEATLRETTSRLASLVKASPLAIISLDTEGKVTDWNEAAERVLGWEAEEVLGRPNPIVPPEKREEYRALQAQLLKSEQLPMLEIAGRRKDGSDITISLSSALLRDAEGRVNGSMAILTDLTDRKKLEHQLRQAQKMEAVGQLAGGVAHDFNNILSAIIGYAHLALMRTHEDDPLRHSQEQILASAERASHLTQSLLAFSRKQIINPKPIDINELIRRFDKFLRRLIREDIQLTIACSDADLTVMADSGQIEQVLMNLATNANDAMPDTGSLTITADRVTLDEEFTRLHGYGKKGTYALITVADTGFGMDRKTQEKIFEPFFTTKEPGKGTGLGLSIAYGIVKQHDGFINVYSEAGKGTTFKIYLPKVAAGSEEAAMTKASEALVVKGGSETVLVAEDDESLRKLTTAMLGEFGYKVIQAEDGEDALNKFRENRETVRLLIVDTVMPKRNGKEVFDEIKGLNPRIKVLFTSGYPADIIHKKGILDKALPFIAKPFGPNELLKKVREALDS